MAQGTTDDATRETKDDATAHGLPEEALATLTCVLDAIVPASGDGRLPGAGALGLAPDVAAGAGAAPEMRAALEAGLAALSERARAEGAARVADLPAERRRALLEAVADEQPGFLPPLVFQTYVKYYEHPTVLEALGHAPRPPWPEGYTVPPTDFSVLDPVREREPFFRRPR